MSTPTIQQETDVTGTDTGVEAEFEPFDPFTLDIAFIEDTPGANTILMCSTNDTCGSSCPSACTTS